MVKKIVSRKLYGFPTVKLFALPELAGRCDTSLGETETCAALRSQMLIDGSDALIQVPTSRCQLLAVIVSMLVLCLPTIKVISTWMH
jgi:hypothetical protein